MPGCNGRSVYTALSLACVLFTHPVCYLTELHPQLEEGCAKLPVLVKITCSALSYCGLCWGLRSQMKL